MRPFVVTPTRKARDEGFLLRVFRQPSLLLVLFLQLVQVLGVLFLRKVDGRVRVGFGATLDEFVCSPNSVVSARGFKRAREVRTIS